MKVYTEGCVLANWHMLATGTYALWPFVILQRGTHSFQRMLREDCALEIAFE